MTQAKMVEGTVAFCNLKEHETYKGQSTGRYSLVVTLDPESANQLEADGVKLKEYEGRMQRKFASKFHVPIVDANDAPVDGEIPYGSTVRLLYKVGPSHPQFGCSTYLDRVRVLQFADNEAESSVPAEF